MATRRKKLSSHIPYMPMPLRPCATLTQLDVEQKRFVSLVGKLDLDVPEDLEQLLAYEPFLLSMLPPRAPRRPARDAGGGAAYDAAFVCQFRGHQAEGGGGGGCERGAGTGGGQGPATRETALQHWKE